jgi:ribonuclease D
MPDRRPSQSITTQEGLDDLVAHLHDVRRFAFDTEFVSEDSYEPELGLVQVASAERLAAVDPLAVPDLGPLWEAIHDPAIEVVTHAAGEDLRILWFRTGRLPSRVVDVQVAAGLIGFGYPSSLGHLVGQVLGVSLAGGETRTDWTRRPLSPAQLRYALDDVRHLLELADRIDVQLDRMGRRTWAEDEYRAALQAVADREAGDRWRRLPGLSSLSRRGLEAARRLYDWRRQEARRADRPVRQVMRDDLLVAIARRLPATAADLEALRDFNRRHLLAAERDILRALEEARDTPDDQLPHHADRPDDGPGLTMLVNLLSAVMSRCCSEHRIAPGLLGTSSDLKALVRWHLAGRPEEDLPTLALGWREGVCGRLLTEVLAGRRSLRVVDPASDVPVALDATADAGSPAAP